MGAGAARRPDRSEPGGLPTEPQARAQAPALERGRRALADYDYEGARLAFEEGLAAGPMSVPAAVALLELLVDHLCADEEALAVARGLRPAVRSSPAVRGLVAEAAARCGEEELALASVDGAGGARAAAAWASLARAALGAGRIGDARLRRQRLADVDPTHPDVLSLERGIEAAQAGSHREDERAIEALMQAGRWREAREAAAALLGRWPGSETARRAVAECARLLDEDLAAALVRDADSAEAGGAVRQALDLLRKAAERGAPAIAERIAGLEARVRADDHRRAAADVLALWKRGDREGALIAWASQDAGARAVVEPQWSEPIHDWLRELGALETRRPVDEVRAALALEGAAAALEAGRPQDAMAAIQANGLLRRLSAARELERRARQANDQQGRAEAESALATAAARLREGDHEGAIEVLSQVTAERLPAALAASLSAAVNDTRRQREDARLRAAIDGMERAGDWLGARDLARRVATETGEARWQSRAAEADLRLRTAWAFAVLPGEVAWADLRDFHLRTLVCNANTWLGPGGSDLFLVDTRDRLVCVRRVEVATGAVREVVVLMTPAVIGGRQVHVEDDRLWVLGVSGHLVLSVEPWDIAGWHSEDEPAATDEPEAGPFVAHGGRFLWLGGGRGTGGEARACRIVDMEGWRTDRVVPSCMALSGLGAGPDGVVARYDGAGSLFFHAPRGGLAARLQVTVNTRVAVLPPLDRGGALVVAPTKVLRETVLLRVDDRAAGSVVVMSIRWTDAVAGIAPARLVLPEVNWLEGGPNVAVASSLVLVGRPGTGGEKRLVAVALTDRGLVRRWNVELPGTTILAQDAAGTAACVIGQTARGTWVEALGPVPPCLDSSRFENAGKVCSVAPPFTMLADPAVHSRVEGFTVVNGAPPEEDVAGWARPLAQDLAEDGDSLFLLAAGLRVYGRVEESEATLAQALARFPANPWLRAGVLHAHAEARRWTEVETAAAAVDLSRLPRGIGAHVHHLRGVARLHLGDVAGARESWKEALATGVMDNVTNLVDYADELLDSGDPSARFVDMPLMGTILRAIRASDALADRGDDEAALAAIDLPPIWLGVELQCAARIAALHLRIQPSGLAAGYRRAVALAEFLELCAGADREDVQDLPLGAATWGRERLDGLCQEARRELMKATDWGSPDGCGR